MKLRRLEFPPPTPEQQALADENMRIMSRVMQAVKSCYEQAAEHSTLEQLAAMIVECTMEERQIVCQIRLRKEGENGTWVWKPAFFTNM